jgi:hypothetical protein
LCAPPQIKVDVAFAFNSDDFDQQQQLNLKLDFEKMLKRKEPGKRMSKAGFGRKLSTETMKYLAESKLKTRSPRANELGIMKKYLAAVCGRKDDLKMTGRQFFDEILLPAVEFHMDLVTSKLDLERLHMNNLSPDETPSLDYLGMITHNTVRAPRKTLK